MKRIAAAPLWFLVGWYIGSAMAWALGLGPWFAPITAVALASLVVADPGRIIWERPSKDETRPAARTTASVDAHSV
jgi:uncharacterized membrane protein